MPPRNTMIKHTRYLVYLSRTTYNLCSFCSWRKQTESNPSRQPLRTAQRGGETKIRGTGIIPPCNTPLHALSPIHSAVLSLSCPCVRHENVTLTGRNLYIVPQFHRSYATPPPLPHCLSSTFKSCTHSRSLFHGPVSAGPLLQFITSSVGSPVDIKRIRKTFEYHIK